MPPNENTKAEVKKSEEADIKQNIMYKIIRDS